MAKDLNKVQLIGRLGKDVEMRYTQAGKAVSSFSVASGRSWKNASGAAQEETEWFNVVAWEKLGEICNQYLNKGSRVYIEGRLATRKWEGDDGVTHYKTEVIAADMIMLDGKPTDAANNGNQQPAERPQAQSEPATRTPDRNVPQAVDDSDSLPF